MRNDNRKFHKIKQFRQQAARKKSTSRLELRLIKLLKMDNNYIMLNKTTWASVSRFCHRTTSHPYIIINDYFKYSQTFTYTLIQTFVVSKKKSEMTFFFTYTKITYTCNYNIIEEICKLKF